jgi:hypothetical protein
VSLSVRSVDSYTDEVSLFVMFVDSYTDEVRLSVWFVASYIDKVSLCPRPYGGSNYNIQSNSRFPYI